ncbi:MAG: hypothetical protein P8Z80_12790 [Pseudolabrys sp.]
MADRLFPCCYFHVAWWGSIIAIPLFAWMFWVSLNWNKPHEH